MAGVFCWFLGGQIMKIKISKNRKTFFFYLVLLDFVIALQIGAVFAFSHDALRFSEKWMSESFLLSFSSALPIFLLFSGMFKNSKRIKSVIRPGLVFMILGSLASFCATAPSVFTFGRMFCGLGAGMLIAGQIGIIWHEKLKRIRIFSPAILVALILGLIFGPDFVLVLSGPDFSALKVVFLLGMIFPFLVVIEIITEIFVATFNTTVDATGAFFDIDGDDNFETRTKKVAKTTFLRVVYNFFDYGLSFICAGMVGALNYWGFAFWKIVLITWLFDFISATVFMIIAVRSGQDITLGESFRRAMDNMRANSRLMSYLVGIFLGIRSLLWEGPEQLVIFFKAEIRTEKRMALVLLVLTFFQGIFWAWVYSLGYESLEVLIRHIF